MSPKSTLYPIEVVLTQLDQLYPHHPMGILTEGNPYKVLVACIMSLRTKDDLTIPLAEKLFQIADTPEKMVQLSVKEIETLIYPVGFYKTKAQTIFTISQELLLHHHGQVPDTVEALLQFKGVGRKTANLVVGLGHKKPAVCVDVHVHRICNRLGYLITQTPEDTEMALRQNLSVTFWPIVNRVLVRHGQVCCKPVSPLCHTCEIASFCQKVNVRPAKPPKFKPLTP